MDLTAWLVSISVTYMNTNQTAPINTSHLTYDLAWEETNGTEREYDVLLKGKNIGFVLSDQFLTDPENEAAGKIERWNFKRFDGKWGCGLSRTAAILQSYENDVPA